MMPHLNGMDVCDKVKNELAFPDIHVVLLTAKGQEIDKQKGTAAGADQYLTKPFDPDFLLSMARRVLGIAE
jgi:two-component system, OmpR family, alkaline phosphatase synthesis response regulator PhoP